MNKKILLGVSIFAISSLSVINVNFNSQKSNLSNASLANVEALASAEGTGGSSCYSNVTEAPNDNSIAISVRKCSSCRVVWATSASNTSTCS